MFCAKCGTQLDDGTEFCPKCGASQTGAETPQQNYRAPNYEFKTVRCYPSDYTENKYREFYENCGWTILDMDRKQVYSGQDSSGTQHYSTQTHIKMQRDKNMPNYEEIRKLSDTAEEYFDTTAKTKPTTRWIIVAVVAILGLIFNLLFGAPALIAVPFAVIIGVCVLMFTLAVTKNKKMRKIYYANKAISDKAYEECKKLVAQSK